jgi:hypothetical protein
MACLQRGRKRGIFGRTGRKLGGGIGGDGPSRARLPAVLFGPGNGCQGDRSVLRGCRRLGARDSEKTRARRPTYHEFVIRALYRNKLKNRPNCRVGPCVKVEMNGRA